MPRVRFSLTILSAVLLLWSTASVLYTSLAFSQTPNFPAPPKASGVAKFVDPFIGTANEGNTHPGALVPWGMVSVSPHNDFGAPSGYRAGRDRIHGFGHVHISGAGCSDLGNIVLMPTTGTGGNGADANAANANFTLKTEPKDYQSRYANEVASPGYYAVTLTDYGVRAEMTATARAGLSRYTFPKSDNATVLIDVSQGQTPSRGGEVRIISNTELEGSNISGGFCGKANSQPVFFVMQFSKPALASGVWKGAVVSGEKSIEGDVSRRTEGADIGAYFRFSTAENEQVLIKTGISYTSIDNARKNLNAELSGWNFDAVRAAAEGQWNAELGRIEVETAVDSLKTMFYSALYHMLIHPNIISDVSGDYPLMVIDSPDHNQNRRVRTGGIGNAKGYTRYTLYSLWDTYRNLHPFLTLVYPERQLDMVKTMTGQAQETGWLPKWELAANETGVMVGDPATPVIADTYIKGITGFDIETAYNAARQAASQPSTASKKNPLRPALRDYLEKGYLPDDRTGDEYVWGSVSDALEYAFADWTLAQLAARLGKTEDAKQFTRQAMSYKNYFDRETKFLRPRKTDGSFLSPFNPAEGGFPGGRGFVEGSAWQYLFFVPHDAQGLAELLGGADYFVSKLQEACDNGQFVLWNEPDMHYPYLFTHFNAEAWRAQKEVRKAMMSNYKLGAAGLPGNDDTGVTSAWLVFSMMGFYPTAPGSVRYDIGSPVFDKVTVKLQPKFHAGKILVIESQNAPSKNPYIASATLNGAGYDKAYIVHEDLTKGGTLKFVMSETPTYWAGTAVAPKILEQPRSLKVTENDSAFFTVIAGGSGPFDIEWRRNGAAIAGAKNLTLRLPRVTMAEKNAQVVCVIKTPLGTVSSEAATLTVLSDKTPPQALRVEGSIADVRSIRVVFSEPVDKAVAENPATYSLTTGGRAQAPTVKAATLDADGKAAVLQTSALAAQQSYTLTVSALKDRAAKPNVKTGKIPFDLGGDGLRETIYDNADFTGKSLVRVVPQVRYDWKEGSPDPAIGDDTFSIRWEAELKAPRTEVYTFIAKTDDGVRLYIDDKLIAESWRNQSPTESVGSVKLEAGKRYKLRMAYYEDGGGASAELYWSSPTLPRELLTQRYLYSGEPAKK